MNLSSKKNRDYRKYYDGKQVHYYVSITDNAMANAFLKEKKKFLKKLVRKKFKNQKIDYMDVACGYGRLTCFFEQLVTSSTGIDVSADMLKVAKKNCKKTKFLLHDLATKPLKKKFDLITSFRFFVNAQPKLRKKMMSGIGKSLEKDGLFIFNIHKNLSIPLLVFALGQRIFSGRKTNIVSSRQVRSLLKGKFIIKKVYGFDYLGASRLSFIKNRTAISFFLGVDYFMKTILPKTWATNVVYMCKLADKRSS